MSDGALKAIITDLAFCFRAYKLGYEEALAQLGARFTDEQWALLGDIVYELHGEEAIDSSQDSGFFSNGDSDGYSDTEEAEEGEPDEGEEVEEGVVANRRAAALDRAIYRFLVSSIKQNVGGNAYVNPLLCFCAALGIRKQPLGYAEPQLYTGMLAAVLWWARLVLLEAAFEGQTCELARQDTQAPTIHRHLHLERGLQRHGSP